MSSIFEKSSLSMLNLNAFNDSSNCSEVLAPIIVDATKSKCFEYATAKVTGEIPYSRANSKYFAVAAFVLSFTNLVAWAWTLGLSCFIYAENLARFESIQNNFSLLNPRFLDELSTVCKNENISLLPYSPIAGGVLSGKYNNNFFPEDARFTAYVKHENPRVQAQATRFVNDKTKEATARYMSLAKEYGISPVTLAVAYSKHFDFVASTIIGARTLSQVDESLAAFKFKIDAELMKKIEEIQKGILYPMG